MTNISLPEVIAPPLFIEAKRAAASGLSPFEEVDLGGASSGGSTAGGGGGGGAPAVAGGLAAATYSVPYNLKNIHGSCTLTQTTG